VLKHTETCKMFNGVNQS